MSLEIVVRALDAAGVRYALIGGLALAACGAARATVDVDALEELPREMNERWQRVLAG